MTGRASGNPFGHGYTQIPDLGLFVPTPSPGYQRFRPILGTRQSVECGTAACGGLADIIFFWGFPAQPYCPACWAKVEWFDSARAFLARRDETGVWRPTSQLGSIREEPFDFDW